MGNLTAFNRLPFALPDEFGKVLHSRTECPGVYYMLIGKKNKNNTMLEYEYYVVTDEAAMISTAARAYGEQICTSPVLLAYKLDDVSKGKYIIDYEVLRYKIQNDLPLPETETIHEVVAVGRELNPDYFGAFPVPQLTPWGNTLRYEVITNGLYWIEIDTIQNVLAVCYTLQTDLSSDAVDLSRLTDYDAEHGLDSTMGYMFFSEKDSCIPLFELLESHAEWQNCINKAALNNAILEYHPEYAMKNNTYEMEGKNDHLGNLMKSLHGGFKLHRSEDNLIINYEQAGTKFIEFEGNQNLPINNILAYPLRAGIYKDDYTNLSLPTDLTFGKVLNAFKDYLDEDDMYDIVETSHGYLIMSWDSERDYYDTFELCGTLQDMVKHLLFAVENFVRYTYKCLEGDMTEDAKEQLRIRQEKYLNELRS